MTLFLFVRNFKFVVLLAALGFTTVSWGQTIKTCLSFYYPSDDFIPGNFAVLDSVLDAHPGAKLVQGNIVSTCDDVGDEAYNKRLAAKRASVLRDSLRQRLGIQCRIRGIGEIPLQSADTLAERAKNRKSELCLILEMPVVASAPLILKAGEKVTLRNLLFFPGHNDLRPGSKPTVDSLVSALKQNPNLKIHIIGHVCCTPAGKDGLDMETGIENLSFSRAQRVYDLLILSGIPANRLSFEGRGGNEPLGKGDNYDRRVEIEVRE